MGKMDAVKSQKTSGFFYTAWLKNGSVPAQKTNTSKKFLNVRISWFAFDCFQRMFLILPVLGHMSIPAGPV